PTERRLAEVSGMSRARVRERLSGLQMLGMLKKVQGSGNVLVTSSFDGGSGNVFELMLRAGMVTVSQIAEAREMLEVAIAPRMVERVTDQQIHELEDLVYAMVDASANRDFAGGLEASSCTPWWTPPRTATSPAVSRPTTPSTSPCSRSSA